MLRPAEMPISSLLPNTQYFEFNSKATNRTFGVWVTTPFSYHASGQETYPAIFTPDGNLFAPMSIPFVAILSGGSSGGDLINPIRPYIQVTIGYCGAEALDPSTRFRDLLPPGEPMPKAIDNAIKAFVAAGDWSRELETAARAKFQDVRADLFLKFLTEELYPAVAANWRIDPGATGFFGDSYGGLFAVWLALQRPKQFPIVGAGSPGISCPESKVWELLEQEYAGDTDHTGRHLHLSCADRELTVPSYFQEVVAVQYARLLAALGRRPLKGLKVTAHTVPFESHMTAVPANFFSFLRAGYSAAGQQ